MRALKRRFSIDPYLLFSCILFLIFTLPFIKALPYLDGNIDFLQSNNVYIGGIQMYLHRWSSIHPPFKFLLTTIAYWIGGFGISQYNSVGICLGVLGIVITYAIMHKLADKTTARIAGLLVTTSPLYICISFSGLNDFIITVMILLTGYLYITKRYIWYGVTSICLVLTKETGILWPIAILLTETLFITNQLKQLPTNIKKITGLFLPFFGFAGWIFFLYIHHAQAWKDWIFAPTAKQGAFITVMYNITTGHFINSFAIRQWNQLFILNFSWVYILIGLIGEAWYIYNRPWIHRVDIDSQKIKYIIALTIFIFMYIIAVLSLQTYTIPRYTLPVSISILLLSSIVITMIIKNSPIKRYLMLSVLVSIGILRLYTSVDPLSLNLWNRTTIYGQTLYRTMDKQGGNDAITYNMQYLWISNDRSEEILSSIGKNTVVSKDCDWIYRDIHNEIVVLRILTKNSQYMLPRCQQK